MHLKHLVFTLFALIFLLLIWFFCLVVFTSNSPTAKPSVVCTTSIIGDCIKNIAQDTIVLHVLMGPGIDPHIYKPIEQDVSKIAQADIIFYNGLHLEARMGDLFATMTHLKTTIAVTQDIPIKSLIQSSEHALYFDPHVWFDPTLWCYAIETITKTLQQKIPQHFDFYEKNKQTFLKQIHQTYDQTKKLIQKIPKQQRMLITGHDAFSYFAHAYDCAVISLQGISTASEAGTKDMQHLIHIIYTHKIPTIFAETSIPRRNIEALQQHVTQLGFQVKIGKHLLSDALGCQNTSQGNYLGMLAWNAQAIYDGLNQSL